jgi:membrane protein implicated in regulation of membrane protease activity
MSSFLASPELQPFSIAGLILIGLLALEIGSSLFGASASTLLDSIFGLHGVHVELSHGVEAHAADADGGFTHTPDGPFATVFDWLNAGRVPLLVLMMAAIACFAVTGMVLQILAIHLVAPVPTGVAVAVAVAAAIPGTRWTSRLVSWIVPRDETYALEDEDLIGRVGTVTLGPVADGAAARAKVQDKYGNWHFPRVAPAEPALSIPEGARVLFIEKRGGAYAVIAAEGRLAPPPP